MIVVKLKGGLGNQLFQYAAGLSLSRRTGRELFLDLSFLELHDLNYTKRDFDLAQFTLNYQLADKDLVNKAKGRSVLQKFLRESAETINESNILRSDFKGKKILLLDGYFQAERFFSDVREELLAGIKPAGDWGSNFNRLKEQVRNSRSVAVHVRRGDYVHLSSANSFHGVCGLDYFKRAMDYFTANEPPVNFFVFSDDIDWCRKNFPASYPLHFCDEKQERSGADMLLMSYCEHQVISNSSYSWWAAWLNDNASRTVIAPVKWFAKEELNSNDIYCKDWIRL